METPAPFFPFHCAKFRANYIQEPCSKNLARIKALKEKAGKSWGTVGGQLGPLEACLECKGRDLVTRENPASINPGPVIISATTNEVEKMNTPLGSEKDAQNIPEIFPEAPRCPKHPDQPQIGMSGKRAGQFMGACKACMAERRVKSISKVQNSLTSVCQIAPAELPINIHPSAAPGKTTGKPAPLLLVEMLFIDFPEELAWLQEFARTRIRTPKEQLLFIVRILSRKFYGAEQFQRFI